jgi:alpha-N-acetylglucosamine transferase
VVQNSDELFEREELSAAPDIGLSTLNLNENCSPFPGWPDFFNSGVFVFVPSLETYRQLVQFGLEHGTFDGGDQGLLNKWFKDFHTWDSSHRLSFIYNMTAGAIYSYAAALKRLVYLHLILFNRFSVMAETSKSCISSDDRSLGILSAAALPRTNIEASGMVFLKRT